MVYKGKDGNWYSHKESSAEYRRRHGVCGVTGGPFDTWFAVWWVVALFNWPIMTLKVSIYLIVFWWMFSPVVWLGEEYNWGRRGWGCATLVIGVFLGLNGLGLVGLVCMGFGGWMCLAGK